MSEILADSKYSPATVVGGRRVSFSRKTPHTHKPTTEPAPVATQDEPVENKDYPRPPPPPAFAAEHGLPIETKNEHKGAYAPFPRGDMSTSPKASFVHLHKSEVGRR